MKYIGEHTSNPINRYVRSNKKYHYWVCSNCSGIFWSRNPLATPICNCGPNGPNGPNATNTQRR
jgi:hypothetical protein